MTNKKPKIITEGYNCVIRNKKKKKMNTWLMKHKKVAWQISEKQRNIKKN